MTTEQEQFEAEARELDRQVQELVDHQTTQQKRQELRDKVCNPKIRRVVSLWRQKLAELEATREQLRLLDYKADMIRTHDALRLRGVVDGLGLAIKALADD